MKIFAKRKRKSVDAANGEGSNNNRVFKSDPVVEELLKQDESTWNAKQRRMVKRYQDRKEECGVDGETVENREKDEEDDTPSEVVGETATKEEVQIPAVTQKTNDSDAKDNSEPKKEEDNSAGQDKKAIDSDLQALLDKLSSKPRRKLIRSLERDGNVDEVRAEAEALLGIKQEAEAKSKSAAESPKRKRRRGPADWTSLPPDERLRREEQRRLQQEAAESQKNDESKHKHPLNSERRRANRRKPKHVKRSKPAWSGNEHHTSGFHMRRIEKGLPS